jgi:hypothetical protein
MIDTAECRSAYGVVEPMPAHHRPKQASVRDAEARCRRR